MSKRLLWTMLLGVGLSLAVLIASSHRATVADLLRYDFASLLVKIALLVFIGGLVLTLLFREPLSRALEAALFWVVVALLLVVGYTYRFDLRDVVFRLLVGLVQRQDFAVGPQRTRILGIRRQCGISHGGIRGS